MAYTPPLEEIITDALDGRLRDVFVALPAKVVSRDLSDNTVDVEVQVRMPVPKLSDDSTDHETLPVLPAVPVLFTKAGPISITFPISSGDTGLLLVLSYSISQWLDSAQVSKPGDTRISHLSNAVFLPGLCPKAEIPAAAAVNALVLEADEVRVGAAATRELAWAHKVEEELSALKATLLTGTANLTTGAVTFATPYDGPDPVGCTKLKSE